MSLPHGFWKLGRIQKLYPGCDGLFRSALVRVATREQQHTLLKRPLQRLYPLELTDEDPPTESSPESGFQPHPVTHPDGKMQDRRVQDGTPNPDGETPDTPMLSTGQPVHAAAKRASARR